MNLSARLTTVMACLLWVAMALAIPAMAQQPSQPQPPMVFDGFAYVNGVKAEDNTLVEAKIGSQTVASAKTTTFAGQKGRYSGLKVQGTADDEVELFVGGVKANEGPVPYAYGTKMLNLTVGQTAPPSYTLNVVVVGSGQTNPPAGPSSYPAGSMVLISAAPAPGWAFVGWVGNVNNPGGLATWTIMEGNKSVTANFAMPTPTPTSGPSPTPTTGPSPTPRPPTPTVPGVPPTAKPLPTNTLAPGVTPSPTSSAAALTPTRTPTAGATVSGLAALTPTRTPAGGPTASGPTAVPTSGAGPAVAGATVSPTAAAGPAAATATPGAVASGPTLIPMSTLQLYTPSPTPIPPSAPTALAPRSPTPPPVVAPQATPSAGVGFVWWAVAIVVVLAGAIGLGAWGRKRWGGAR